MILVPWDLENRAPVYTGAPFLHFHRFPKNFEKVSNIISQTLICGCLLTPKFTSKCFWKGSQKITAHACHKIQNNYKKTPPQWTIVFYTFGVVCRYFVLHVARLVRQGSPGCPHTKKTPKQHNKYILRAWTPSQTIPTCPASCPRFGKQCSSQNNIAFSKVLQVAPKNQIQNIQKKQKHFHTGPFFVQF